MSIAGNIALLRNEIPPHVRIIAVSKTMPVQFIREAYDAGQRAFGENKVQELLQKQPLMPPETEWHLIGHLQTNKVKFIVPFITLIHSVDSLALLSEINREASRNNRIVDCLLQLRIAKEETKFGLFFPDAKSIFELTEFKSFKHVRLKGLMGMATFTEDSAVVKDEFLQLARYFKEIKNNWFAGDESFKELSMGMSGDYKLAIEAVSQWSGSAV